MGVETLTSPDIFSPEIVSCDLRQEFTNLSVPDYAFRHSPVTVVQMAERLVEKYEVNPGIIVKDPVRGLLALALADEWLETEDQSAQRSLLDVLKVMTTGEDENRNYVTQSGVVKRLSARGLSRGTLYDPRFARREKDGQPSPYDRYLEMHRNEELTQEARSLVSDWGEGSELNTVRNTLGITKATEEPYELFVLDRTSLELGNEIGRGGGAFRVEQRIFLPSNHRNYRYLDHEYAHVQSDGLAFGHRGYLSRYLDEAITESVTKIPTTYKSQRKVLDILCNSIPDLYPDALNAYMDDKDLGFQMYSKIVNRYGLEGYLAVIRLGSEDVNNDLVEQSVHVHPDQVLNLLERIDGEIDSSKKVA